jgi:DNA-binding NarL/FixJ family response regulator
MLKIGLIDNYPIARKGLGLLLEERFLDIQIWDAKNATELQKKLGDQVPDIIILSNNTDQKSPLVSEVTVCRRTFSDARMIVLDETYQPGNSALYLRSGIMGHVLKECRVNELISCVQSVEKNKCFLSTKLHFLALEETGHISSWQGKISRVIVKNMTLSTRELQIAFHLCQGKGTSYIARLMKKTPSQVSGIKRRILRKMKVDNVPDLAVVIDGYSLESLANA